MRRRIGPALAGAALAMHVPPSLAAADFVCRGHDPGWEFQGADGRAVYKPGRGAPRNLAGGAADLAAEGVVVWRGRAGGDGGGGGDVVAVMLKGACTDPAAGDLATHSAIVSLPGSVVVVGCCNLGTGRGGAAVAALGPETPAGAPTPVPAAAPPPTAPLPPPASEEVAPSGGPPPAERVAAAVTPPPRARATVAKAADAVRPGAGARIAGPARERVYLRLDASERARVAGSLPGGHAVVVGKAARRGGRTWYQVSGKGVPDRAWIRGDLLVGG